MPGSIPNRRPWSATRRGGVTGHQEADPEEERAFLDFYFDRALAGESPPGWFWTSFVTYAFLHGGM
ncbi:MAG: hypothetical protein AAGI30_09995, partial [Planctomycetota bacterium]